MLFPVWRELLCDGETPVGVFARLRRCLASRDQHSFLLESVVGGERWARWSFIGVGHRAVVRGWWREGRLVVECEPGPGFESPLGSLGGPRGGVGEGSGAALIEDLLTRYRGGVDPDEPAAGGDELPRFWGGLVGVWGHDMVRDLERIPTPAWTSPADLPAFELLVTDTLVVFDNLSQKVRVFATACPAEDGGVVQARAAARRRVDAVVAALRQGPTLQPRRLDEALTAPSPELAAAWTGAGFPSQVEQAKQFIGSGDVFQVVLSQRFDQPRARAGHDVDPLDVYRMLRVTNPAPYMYLLELPSASLAGASPEVLVRVDAADRRVTVRPLAGTRGRGRDLAEDQALERELLADPKERAEHLMLIDLGRNDIGRIAAAGSVEVAASFEIERYSKVMHIVSEVSGVLADGLSVVDALRSTFPAGTLSGAPKVRALEIIDELEPAPRGWYGGAVGYFGYDGGADFAICIRTVVLTPDSVRVQAGAGIVYDSDPDAEDEECGRKAAAVLRAIELARASAGAVPEPGEGA
ncbi:anthranilate synthase component I family protein [Enhygromyxa salina]|uniref:Anthranilate synthase component 1 n=1 Tax=Enhygromyxa salina TaxID=215803 RepID=A0A2S9Y3B2_9BACT|nr:anthranilate synthase component I family protein [Enhygromyxa salina]PRP99582.1 Anthranilate synthase component 1 [Enhygromyxa salina]